MKLLDRIIKILRAESKKVIDNREKSKCKYTMEDIFLSAFSVFYFQNPSWLSSQRQMSTASGRSNAESLFQLEKIPTDNHIRDVLDGVDRKLLENIYNKIYEIVLKESHILDEYEFGKRTLIIAIDGTYYYSSSKINCIHCQSKSDKYNGKVIYHHSAITPVIVHPRLNKVLPLFPEMIRNEDGKEKQDCEINASKRWLQKFELFKDYKIIILGDDLYSRSPFIEEVLAKGHSYIFVAKESSHKFMYEEIEFIKNIGKMDIKVDNRINKREKEKREYKFLNDVDLVKDNSKSTKTNWMNLEVTNKNNVTKYRNSFITDIRLNDNNIIELLKIARRRWKVENENNNVLKNNGYHLEHNFGHGKNGLSEFLFTLNILSFLIHEVCMYMNEDYKKLYKLLVTREDFFKAINFFSMFIYVKSWEEMFQMMIKGHIEGLHIK